LLSAGHPASVRDGPDSAARELRARSARVAVGDQTHAPLLFVPAASGGEVVAEGAAVQVFDRGGGAREVYVYPRGGDYHVHLATAPAARVAAAQAGTAAAIASLPDTAADGSRVWAPAAVLVLGALHVARRRRRD